MKITKKRLRRIIKEMTISAREAEDYLRDKATSYERDGLRGRGMKMLLQDDFLDDLGHQHNIEDYEWLIDELVDGVNESIKITKRQLRKNIKEERQKLFLEAQDPSLLPLVLEAINNGTARATMGLGLGRDEIMISFGDGPDKSVALKLRSF